MLRDLIHQVGVIRAAEVTYGGNGWHPHMHLLVLTERPVPDDVRGAWAAKLHERWVAWCARKEWGAPKWGVGVRVDHVWGAQVLSAYVAKVQDDKWQQNANWRVGREVARGDLKRGRMIGRTPFELLEEYADLRGLDASDRRRRVIRRLWREFEAGSKGRSSVRWSRDLRDRFGLDERSDEAIADAVQSEGSEPVAQFDVPTWAAICRTPGARERLLEIAEDPGSGGGARVLRVARELRQLELRAPGEFWDPSVAIDNDGRPVGYGPPWWWSPAVSVFDAWLSRVG